MLIIVPFYVISNINGAKLGHIIIRQFIIFHKFNRNKLDLVVRFKKIVSLYVRVEPYNTIYFHPNCAHFISLSPQIQIQSTFPLIARVHTNQHTRGSGTYHPNSSRYAKHNKCSGLRQSDNILFYLAPKPPPDR